MGRWVAVLAVLTLGVSACASSGGSGSSRGSSRVISAEEMASVSELNCYEAVSRLRPQWLTGRGRVTFNSQQGIRIYVDGALRGYVGELSQLRANAVAGMRYLSAPEATSRFGTDHVDGAILITLKRG